MEIWSEFIHEELFLIKSNSETNVKKIIEFGVVAINTSTEDEELLLGILKATKLNPEAIKRKDKLDGSAHTWLVFKDDLEHNGKLHLPLGKLEEKNQTIILAYPLSRMRSSQNEKAEFWGLLKEHFSL